MGALVEAEKLMQIGVLLPSATFIGWLGGGWLDQIFHQKWIAIVGIFFGAVSGLVYVIQIAVAAEKKASKEDESQAKTPESTEEPHS